MRIDGYTVDCLKGFNGKEVEPLFIFFNKRLFKKQKFYRITMRSEPKILF